MDVATLGIKVEAVGAVKALNDVGTAADRATASTTKLTASTRGVGASVDGLTASERTLLQMMRQVEVAGNSLDTHNRKAVQAYLEQIRQVRELATQTGNLSLVQDRLAAATEKATATHAPHIMGLSRIGNSLAAMVGHATGVPPVLEKIGDAIGIMSIGHLATVGVLAGFAALAFAYEKITAKAKEAAEQSKKTMTEFERIAHLDVAGQGAAVQLLFSGDPNSTDKLKLASMAQLKAQQADFATRANAVITYAGEGGGGAFLSKDAKEAAAALKLVNEELEHRQTLLNAITKQGGSMGRAAMVQQTTDLAQAATEAEAERERKKKEAQRKAEQDAKDAQDIADKQANAQNQLVIDGIKRQQAERLKLDKEADENAKKLADQAAAKERADAAEVARTVRATFTTLFTDIFTNGKGAFQSLWDAIKAGFIKLAADLVSVNIVGRLAKAGVLATLFPGTAGARGGTNSLDGLGREITGQAVGGAAAGGLAGYGFGSMMQDRASGGALGALSGAGAGFLAAGPIGAAVGALSGFVSGILGAGNAAKEAAEHMKTLRESLALTFDEIRATISGDDTAVAIARLKQDFVELRKAIDEAYPESHRVADYRALGGLNLDIIKQLTAFDAAANAVRAGKLAELNDLEQQRIKQITDEAKAAKEATRAGLNLVQGYKLQAAVFNAMAGQSGPSGGSSVPIPVPTGGGRGTPTTLQPVILTMDSKVVGEVLLKQYGLTGASGGSLPTGFGRLVAKWQAQ